MKQGDFLIRLVMVLLAAALAVYLGVYIIQSVQDPFTTTFAYAYTAGDSVRADGFLVRQEEPFPSQGGILELRRNEGERVGVGQTVALVYRDSQAVQVQAQIRALTLEAEVLSYALEQEGDAATSARLDEAILAALTELRGDAGRGDFSRLEEQVVQVKSAVLKRDYTYGAGLSAASLTQKLNQVSDQITALSAQNRGASSAVVASHSGLYSTQVDGYEALLTPERAMTLTPGQLDALAREPVTGGGSRPGKMIYGARWYFAAVLPQQAAERLHQGETVTVRFSGDFSQDVAMRVERIGAPEENRAAVVFSADRYLAQTTLLRQQTAEVVYETFTGLRVPKAALRMSTKNTPAGEGEQPVQEQVLGVYVLMAGKAEFKPVSTVMEGADFYLVRPEGAGSAALKAGDEIIVRATGLYHGKMLEH